MNARHYFGSNMLKSCSLDCVVPDRIRECFTLSQFLRNEGSRCSARPFQVDRCDHPKCGRLECVITSPKNFVFEEVLFSSACMCLCVCVCVSVCLCVCHSIISKSSQSIFMKLGRMVYDDKISVPFEDEINRSVEEHTLPKRMVKKGGK